MGFTFSRLFAIILCGRSVSSIISNIVWINLLQIPGFTSGFSVIHIPDTLLSDVKWYHTVMTSVNSKVQFDWLRKRGITDSVIDAFSISVGDVLHLRLSEAIIIPVRHVDGTHSFNKYRRNPLEGNVKPKYLYDRGGKITLFGADHVVKSITTGIGKPIVITEGELDTLVCWSLGIPAVSSTGGAQSFQEEWVELLNRYEVYICFDNDEAGHKGAVKVLSFLPDAKVIFIPKNIPDVKDISDYVARGGDFHALMRSARSYPDLETVEAEKESIAANWGDYSFHDLYIEANKPKSLPHSAGGGAPTSQSDDRVERAKSVDCLSLLEWERRGQYPVTRCLWHNDNDPSLTYYKRNNSCYCHSCSKYADAIDIVMARDGVTFKEALKLLLKEHD